MKVAIYCKTIPGKTAKAQERALRSLCKKRGWTVQKVYADPPTRSTKLASSKARLSLVTDILSDGSQYEAVLVWRLGLLGNAIDDLLWTLDELHVQRDVRIVAPGDGIDTTAGDGMATKVIKALAKI